MGMIEIRGLASRSGCGSESEDYIRSVHLDTSREVFTDLDSLLARHFFHSSQCSRRGIASVGSDLYLPVQRLELMSSLTLHGS